MKTRLLLLFLLGSLITFAQSIDIHESQSFEGILFDKVQQAKDKEVPVLYDLVDIANENLNSLDISADEVSKGLILDLNYEKMKELKSANSEIIQISLPLPDLSTVTLDLVENKVLATILF